MASNYPTSLDTFTNPSAGASLSSPSHSTQHGDVNDAVEALEAKLGIGSSSASAAAQGAVLKANGSGSTAYAKAGLWLVKEVTIGTGVTTIDVTSCFTSEFDNYRVDVAGPTMNATAGAIGMRLLLGSTPSTTTYFDNTFYVLSGQAGGLTNGNNAGTIGFWVVGSVDTNANYTSFDVYGPNIATHTRMAYTSMDQSYYRFGAGVHKTATAYDGLQVLGNVGQTFTGGKIRVYGYQK